MRSFALLMVWLILPAIVFANQANIDAAKQEKIVVWYTVKPLPDAIAMAKVFEAKYPDIKVEVVRGGGGGRLANRIITEHLAGRGLFDAVTIEMSSIPSLKAKSVLGKINSVEAQYFPRSARDKDGYWVALDQNPLVIGYNTNLVSPRDVPKTWKDLLDPKWRGEIGMYESEFKWYAVLKQEWGEKRAKDFLVRLSQQNLRFTTSHRTTLTLLAAGEFSLALVFPYRAEVMKKEGAPIDWIDSMKPITVSYDVVGISANAKHPNTAKLFIDFLLSQENQEFMKSLGRMPLRNGVPPLSKRLDPARLPLTLFPLPSTENELKDLVEEFRGLLYGK